LTKLTDKSLLIKISKNP